MATITNETVPLPNAGTYELVITSYTGYVFATPYNLDTLYPGTVPLPVMSTESTPPSYYWS